jgi:hypothetical protein
MLDVETNERLTFEAADWSRNRKQQLLKGNQYQDLQQMINI